MNHRNCHFLSTFSKVWKCKKKKSRLLYLDLTYWTPVRSNVSIEYKNTEFFIQVISFPLQLISSKLVKIQTIKRETWDSEQWFSWVWMGTHRCRCLKRPLTSIPGDRQVDPSLQQCWYFPLHLQLLEGLFVTFHALSYLCLSDAILKKKRFNVSF